MPQILQVEGLKKHFVKSNWLGKKVSLTKAVDGVSFTVEQGEVMVLAGESGSGKSTVARLIMRAVVQDSGRVIFDGTEITSRKEDLKKIRTGCQIVYQDPYDSINPLMKIKDIIAEPLEIHRIGDARQRERLVCEVLQEVKLEPVNEIMEKYPHMLSGGQRQRVVLARALVLRPKMIIADEPVSMLDVSIRAEVLDLMDSLRRKYNIAFVYITHDLTTARHFGNTIAIMYLGKIVEMGPINDVLLKPLHPYTQALIDAISEPDAQNLYRQKRVRIIDPPSPQADVGCSFRARCPYAFERCVDEPPLEARDSRSVACFANIEKLTSN